jgi:hypothetical protein
MTDSIEDQHRIARELWNRQQSRAATSNRSGEPELLAEAREALGYTTQGLANFLAYRGDHWLRRCEKDEADIPTLLWLVLFYMLREADKRELMDRVHNIIIQRRPG